jgi:hypothetical protein
MGGARLSERATRDDKDRRRKDQTSAAGSVGDMRWRAGCGLALALRRARLTSAVEVDAGARTSRGVEEFTGQVLRRWLAGANGDLKSGEKGAVKARGQPLERGVRGGGRARGSGAKRRLGTAWEGRKKP